MRPFQRPATEREQGQGCVETTKIVMCSPKQCLCSVDVGEALGLYHAIEWIHDLQLANVNLRNYFVT